MAWDTEKSGEILSAFRVYSHFIVLLRLELIHTTPRTGLASIPFARENSTKSLVASSSSSYDLKPPKECVSTGKDRYTHF